MTHEEAASRPLGSAVLDRGCHRSRVTKSDRQMDGISAGDTPGVFSTSASMSTGGATVTLSTVGTIGGSSTGGGSTGATQQPGIFKNRPCLCRVQRDRGCPRPTGSARNYANQPSRATAQVVLGLRDRTRRQARPGLLRLLQYRVPEQLRLYEYAPGIHPS